MSVALKTWGEALRGMPRLSADQWQQLDPVARWLITCRASVIFMTFTAAALGGLMAWRMAGFSPKLWLASALGLILAHASNNMINDFVDSRRGIDKDDYFRNRYGVHVLEDGLLSATQFLLYLAWSAGIALLIGVWLVSQRGGLALELLLIGSFFVLFYTWPLKQLGLGEPRSCWYGVHSWSVDVSMCKPAPGMRKFCGSALCLAWDPLRSCLASIRINSMLTAQRVCAHCQSCLEKRFRAEQHRA